ncbi:MAG: RNA-directed DNA polymerase [Gammaproteobacteria bacterium]|nr:RNA-directed DNA polymerase [Gammaproteobacteria bacterium]
MSPYGPGLIRCPVPMEAANHQSVPANVEIRAAFSECRQRWTDSLIIDPLGHPQAYDTALTVQTHDADAVEAELVTRPKAGGGTRLEIVPDCLTSLRLQTVARQMRDRIFPSPHSVLSAHSPGAQQYALWSETIPLWIRQRLVDGKTVLVADVENYFGSVPQALIRNALAHAGLDDTTVENVTDTITRINSIPDRAGATRTGLPVSQDDLFWYVADLVLRPVDQRLAQHAGIAGYLRWVDDFFIAVDDTAATSTALRALSAALAPMGLRLNLSKTRVLTSLPQYDREFLTHQHRTVSSLRLTSQRAPLSKSQRQAFERLCELERIQSAEHGRLWKRIYALAAHLRSCALASEAINDFTHFPTAEAQISTYLEAVNWPDGTATQAAELLLNRATTDTQAINLLQRLLASQRSNEHQARSALSGLLASSRGDIHPYTLSLVHAFLAAGVSADQYAAADQERLIPLATDSTSPMARRLAIQLLWLIPRKRAVLEAQIGNDPSYTVRSLANLLPDGSHATTHFRPATHTHRSVPTVSLSARDAAANSRGICLRVD